MVSTWETAHISPFFFTNLDCFNLFTKSCCGNGGSTRWLSLFGMVENSFVLLQRMSNVTFIPVHWREKYPTGCLLDIRDMLLSRAACGRVCGCNPESHCGLLLTEWLFWAKWNATEANWLLGVRKAWFGVQLSINNSSPYTTYISGNIWSFLEGSLASLS